MAAEKLSWRNSGIVETCEKMTATPDKRELRCSSCGRGNDADAKFCNECSAPLLVPCTACGHLNRLPAKFCGECAAQLPAMAAKAEPAFESTYPPPPNDADAPPDSRTSQDERRHLTVLFCDLVGSTELTRNLDPEDWREILVSYHAAATESVERFGGHVAQYLGDGLLVYFGYPHAHDDDPQRAVLSALAILRSISQLNTRLAGQQRPMLSVRIGIHSGFVVVGQSRGRGANIFGNVPNLASRIQDAAAPDTVFISAAVHHL